MRWTEHTDRRIPKQIDRTNHERGSPIKEEKMEQKLWKSQAHDTRTTHVTDAMSEHC